MVDCTALPDNSITLYKDGVQLPATYDPSIDAPIYTITQGDTVDVYVRSVMYPGKKYGLSIGVMGIGVQNCSTNIIEGCVYGQEGSLNSNGCGMQTVTINDTGIYTPSHVVEFSIETQPGGEIAHSFITVIPCSPIWQCEYPLVGYENDGCGHKRLNTRCNPASDYSKYIIPTVALSAITYYAYNEGLIQLSF